MISIGVDNGEVTYFFNQRSIGIPFKDASIINPQNLYPIVYIGNKEDVV